MGGGVVPEMFRHLQEPVRLNGGGGGGEYQTFSVTHLHKPTRFCRERGTYHTFADLPRYSLIDNTISQDTSKNVHQQNNNSHKKNIQTI